MRNCKALPIVEPVQFTLRLNKSAKKHRQDEQGVASRCSPVIQSLILTRSRFGPRLSELLIYNEVPIMNLVPVRFSDVAITREIIKSIYEEMWHCINSGDWDKWLEYYSQNCTFLNSALDESVEGKRSLSDLAKTFPSVINTPDWFAIDDQRLVVSWRERPTGAAENLAYRGVSSFYFDSDGKISDYVGTFNMLEVAKAYS